MCDKQGYITELYRMWGENKDMIHKVSKKCFILTLEVLFGAVVLRAHHNRISQLEAEIEEMKKAKGE